MAAGNDTDGPWNDYKKPVAADGPWNDYKKTDAAEPASAGGTSTGKFYPNGQPIPDDGHVQPVTESQSVHTVLESAAEIAKQKLAPDAAGGAVKQAAKKVGRGVVEGLNFAQKWTPLGSDDTIMGAALHGLTSVVGDAAGKIAGKGVVAAQGKLIPKDLPPELQNAIKAANDMGIPLSPGQLTQSKTLLKLESALRNIPFVADVMGDFDRKQAKLLADARQNLLDAMPDLKTAAEAGETTKALLEKRVSEIDDARKAATDAAQADLERRTAVSAKFQDAAKARLAERQTLLESVEANKYVKERNSLAPGGASVPTNIEDRGAAVKASIDALEDRFLKVRSALYQRAQAAMGDPTAEVELPNLVQTAEKTKAAFPDNGAKSLRGKAYAVAADYTRPSEPPPMPQLPPGMDADKLTPNQLKALPPEVQAQIKSAKAPQTPTMTLEQLQGEIKRLGEAAQNARYESGASSPESLHFENLKRAAESDLDAHFAKDPSSEAKRLYGTAKVFHADYSDRFRNDTIAKMYRASPTKTFTDIMGAKDYESASILVRAMGPEGRKIAQRQMFDQIFGSQAGLPDVKQVLKNLSDYGPGLRAVLTPDQQREFQRFAMTGFASKLGDPMAGIQSTPHMLDAPKFIQDAYETEVRRMIKNSPQELTQNLVPPSGGNVLVAQAAKKYLPKEVFDVHGRQLAENILTGVTAGEGGLKGIRSRFDNYDKDFLETFFGKKQVEGMSRLGDASQLLPGAADLSSKLVGASVGAMYVTGMVLRPTIAFRGVASATLVSLPTLTRAYLSEEGRQYLTTFLRMPENDPRAGRFIAEFAAKFGETRGAARINAAIQSRGAASTTKNDGILRGRGESQ